MINEIKNASNHPTAITLAAEKSLAEIDAKIEEMLLENEALLDRDGVESKEPDAERLIEETRRKRLATAKEGFNQIHSLSESQLNQLYDKMKREEDKTLANLLDLLVSSVSFTGGMQKFIDVAVNQLQLGDIDLRKDKYDPIMQQLLDLRILILLTNALTNEEYKSSLQLTEAELHSKLLYNYFNISSKDVPKDTLTPAISNLQRTLASGIKDLSFEVSKNSNKQNESHNVFLRKLDDSIKRVINRVDKS